ncbi:MAG: hypothetical protein QXK08_00765 [Candidatus Woesearchaeota archaeon]
MDKKAQWESFWVEYVAGAFLIIAFYLSARGAYVGTAYAVAFLIGAILGRFWYTRIKKHMNTLYISIVTLAVLLGIIIGSINTDRRVIVILYVIGILLSYVVHKEKWIRST